MPKQTIYIRDEDMDKWQALEHKSQAIHDLLNLPSLTKPQAKRIVKPPKFSPINITKTKFEETEATEQLCPRHHVPMDLCKAKH